MEAAPVNIIQYFDGSKQGLIPLFQRPYSWEPRDWNTLWADLMAQYNPEDRASHFMGAIVTVPVKSVPVGVGKHLVIDGQQRLTTLSLLLAAIRDKATSEDDTPTEGIIGDFLTNRHYPAPDDLKLVPTQVDRAAYNGVIYRKDLAAYKETRVVQAYRHFLGKLEETDDEGNPLSAKEVLATIQQALQVVMINLGESDDPYLIFESLNHKGKPLNQADLVRNYVLMRFQHSTAAGGEQETAYEDLWRPMEALLGPAMPEFLRHYGMRSGRNVRKGDIYTACKGEFEKLKDVEDVRVRLQEMKRSAEDYATFIHPDDEGSDVLRRGLQAILDLDSTVFYPLLVRLYQSRRDGIIGDEDLANALATLESFYVRRSVCGVPTNALNKMTLELCTNLPEAQPHLWLRERLQSGAGSRRWPSDDEFRDALLTQQLYPRRKLARFVLEALERAHKHKEPVDVSTATMEHVLPQSLSEQWKKDLGAEHLAIHDRWCGTLGNLTLTGYNSELGNLPFSTKKEQLKNTHFELSRDILLADKWGEAEISSRGHRLGKMAVECWPK